nr:RICIN domain-containing protein [Streptomyces adustus]
MPHECALIAKAPPATARHADHRGAGRAGPAHAADVPFSPPALPKEVVVKKLRLATVAAGALIAGAGLLAPTSAQAASTYWTFKNVQYGTCLTAGDSGSAYSTTCVGSNRQQWDWVGDGHSSYHMLKNRETGKCLRTDGVSNVNAVWTSTCDTDADYEWWYYNGDDRVLYVQPGGLDFLSTSSTVKDAVYSQGLDLSNLNLFKWVGTHD